MLLALDPGMNSPGIALFAHNGELLAAGRVRIPAFSTTDSGERWLHVARTIVERVTRGMSWPTSIVFEKPQWYPQSKSKVDPNDLCGIAGVAACVVGLISPRACFENDIVVCSPTPREWIGQVSKVCPTCKGKAKKKCVDCHGSAWETPRGRLIRSRLHAHELNKVPDQNDAIDAVGLGLFALGRLVTRRAFSNGRD